MLPSLKEAAELVSTNTLDPVTQVELMDLIVDVVTRVSAADPATLTRNENSAIVFDAPARPNAGIGEVVRKERTLEEKQALLADPNLPLSVRNSFEADLGLPLTRPGSIAAAPVKSWPYPVIYGADGAAIELSTFEKVEQDSSGTTTVTWGKDVPLAVTRIINGDGHEFPVPANVSLSKGSTIEIPLGKPGLVGGTGNLMRDGRVVHDGPVDDATAALDAAQELALRDRAVAAARLARDEGKLPPQIFDAVTAFGYYPHTAAAIVEDALA